jgi:D-tyrosyl-tRNA(Tyr) deacylase
MSGSASGMLRISCRICSSSSGPGILSSSTKKGNRPSYTRSARPEIAVPLYQQFIARLAQDLGRPVQTGEFGAQMDVSLINDGPVTIIIDSKSRE